MGCNSSHAKTSPKQTKGTLLIRDELSDEYIYYSSKESIHLVFSYLTDEINMFSSSSGMVPSVCLNEKAFPIVVSQIPMESPEATRINLPIVTAAFAGKGRIICLPHLGLLTQLSKKTDDTELFISKIINWVGRPGSTMSPILLFGMPKEMNREAVHALQSIGYFVESHSKPTNLNSYRAIVIPSCLECDATLNQYQKFTNYVNNGGGLIVASYPKDPNHLLEFPVNSFLSQFGIAYTSCSISDQDIVKPFPVDHNFETVQQFHFHGLLEKLSIVLNYEYIDPNMLDDIVTTLRYHIIVSHQTHSKVLCDLYDLCWNYLYSSDSMDDGTFCHDISHGIILVLIQDIIIRLPPEHITPVKGLQYFPGECGDVTLSKFDVNVIIAEDSWTSTGMYLPPGIISHIRCEQNGLYVQVGAQNESMIGKPAPWKRWPCIYRIFNSEQFENIATPYGGIVYIIATPEYSGGENVSIEFDGFVRHPSAKKSDPSIWEQTKNNDVPYGELSSDHVIITMPSKNLRTLESQFDTIYDVFDRTTDTILSFMSGSLHYEYRIVFDVEIPEEEPVCGYPLIFKLEDLHPLLDDLSKPSTQFFQVISLMTVSILREDCFDMALENAFGALTAFVVFSELYPGVDPIKYANIIDPQLFEPLLLVNQRYPGVITQTLSHFQDPTAQVPEVPEDSWIEFVRELCKTGKTDFTKLLERARPIPMNVSSSMFSFPKYTTSEDVSDIPTGTLPSFAESDSEV